MQKTFRIYPIYFNPRIKRAQGRRTPYAPNGHIPTLPQLASALDSLQISHKSLEMEHPSHTQKLTASFLPESSKLEEIEREHEKRGGCLEVKTEMNKHSLIAKMLEELRKREKS